MHDIVVRAEGLGKRYRLGSSKPYHRLSELLMSYARRGVGAAKSITGSRDAELTQSSTPEFWALRHINFEIHQGDVVGIIGRNGAGKSTLLKVLSRITEPTEGRFGVRGRVGSLLEVGTGFHPELTGRENIYLSGTVLGMNREEIRSKFDEIVDFSGVESFLDTPVKRYSSGMQVRLGFAVAAHLEPEVLIVDEVLAVGDAEFQKKCLGKMEGVAGSGRTVLFVSHNMGAVSSLCSKAMQLRDGNLVAFGEVADVIDQYNLSFKETDNQTLDDARRQGDGSVRLEKLTICDEHNRETQVVPMGSTFSVDLVIKGELDNAVIGVMVGDRQHQQLLRGYTWENTTRQINLKGHSTVRCTFKRCPLMHGRYQIHTWIGQFRHVAEFIEDAASITIDAVDVHGSGHVPDPSGGLAFCECDWSVEGQ